MKKQEHIQQNLQRISHTFAIISGKGGVGKTSVVAMLAVLLMRKNYRVGILDVDMHGPNIARMFGLEHESFQVEDQRVQPIIAGDTIRIATTAALGYGEETAFIWRGPMKLGVITQFLSEVDWGDTEILLIDTPPGTGDELMAIAEHVPALTSGIVVSTPQPVAMLDARRSIFFAREMKIPVMGVLENMADSEDLSMFGRDGVKEMTTALDEKFLGSIPLSRDIIQWCEGKILHMSEDILPDFLIKSIINVLNHSS